MKSRLLSFNIYFCAAIVFLGGGCRTGAFSGKKEYTLLRVYLEARNGARTGAQLVSVVGTPMYIESEPILTEGDVNVARLVDYPDGTYAVEVTFNDHGMIQLDMTTGSSKGLDLVIYAQFPPKGARHPKGEDEEGALPAAKTAPGLPRADCWSATPIVREITSGVLVFTPDASHAEAERMVRGLNNLAAEIKKMNQ